ncbi:hypothetical protein M422DRAFT_41495 [Sphaerobolus stellatus SS14]|nr:hypothetical protein M422DRAFT_41495 [Sphaerobolus stellatus SS14]
MGLLKRLFSLGNRPKNKDNKHVTKSKPSSSSTLAPPTSASTSDLLTPPQQDPDIILNRLLRSSSTHFSVLSETEYLSLPPIPHPINNVMMRAPSMMSSTSKQSTSSYTVTVHSRTVHSRTEFPNANGRITPLAESSPPSTPGRHSSVPPLTPGDKNRLIRLKQDASVLSLLNIYDETGRPAPEAFSNTPAPRKRKNSTFRALLGEPTPVSSGAPGEKKEESDLSWAERWIAGTAADRDADEDLDDLASNDDSLEMPNGLFARKSSPEQEDSDVSPDTSLSTDVDDGIDSLQVEFGTAEDGSIIIRATSPQRPASELFKFLTEPAKKEEQAEPKVSEQSIPTTEKEGQEEQKESEQPIPTATPPRLHPSSLKPISQVPKGPRSMVSPGRSMYIRHGPREMQAQLSPAPRRKQDPQPLPAIPSDFRFRAPQSKPAPLEHRGPSSGFSTGEGSMVPRTVSDRTVSVASSVHPEIESHEPMPMPMDVDMHLDTIDPYTPVPKRIGFRKRGRQYEDEENLPPAAPLRGRVRQYPEYGQPTRNKEAAESDMPSPKRKRPSPSVKGLYIYNPVLYFAHSSLQIPPASRHVNKTSPPTTPLRNPTLSKLQTPPARPSPASSTELSPEGRRIMDSVRADKRKFGDMSNRTPRPVWESWGQTIQDTMQS